MTTRQARHNAKTRKARKDAGLCAGCGRPSESYWCAEECQPKRSASQARRRARIREESKS